MEISEISTKQTWINVIKNIAFYIVGIIKKSLYFPYVVSLIMYFFFILIAIQTCISGTSFDKDITESVFRFLTDSNILPKNIFLDEKVSWDTIKIVILDRMIIFGFVFDLVSRSILFWKKTWTHTKIQFFILKFLLIFYLVSGVSLIIFFGFDKPEDLITISIVVFLFVFINLLLLSFASLVTFITNLFLKSDAQYYFSVEHEDDKTSIMVKKILVFIFYVGLIVLFLWFVNWKNS
jgi:hypothetical protein